jgi:hypothetical protein
VCRELQLDGGLYFHNLGIHNYLQGLQHMALRPYLFLLLEGRFHGPLLFVLYHSYYMFTTLIKLFLYWFFLFYE